MLNKDRLRSLTANGVTKSFAYDACGNPITYKDVSMTWTRGRMLESYGNISYTYSAAEKRATKTVGGLTTRYFTAGDKILSEVRETGTSLKYIYGAAGIEGIKELTGSTERMYTVTKDIHGNVHRIYLLGPYNVPKVAEYEYDAWGNCVSVKGYDYATGSQINPGTTHIANLNPFRYRGYYYDAETGLYYLNSRYYDPETGRFVSPDEIDYAVMQSGDFNGVNLYAYCINNPVMYVDPSGYSLTLTAVLAIAAIVAEALLTTAAVALVAVEVTYALYLIETTWHPFESAIDWVSSWGSSGTVAQPGNPAIPSAGIGIGIGVGVGAGEIAWMDDPDPFARPGQKKGGRERKNKSRAKENFKQRNGKRRMTPLPPHHPGRDHRKYLLLWLLLKMLGQDEDY